MWGCKISQIQSLKSWKIKILIFELWRYDIVSFCVNYRFIMSTIKLDFKKDKLKSILKENGVKKYSHLPKSELENMVNQLNKHHPSK